MESNVVIDEYIEHTVDVYMRMYPDSNETQVRQLVTKKIEESLVDIPCTFKLLGLDMGLTYIL